MKQEIVLPKNIRQIGEIQQEKKVYLEDYVMTYIRKKEKEGQEGCAGILVGRKEEDEQGAYLFLTGALLLHPELETEERWKRLEEEKETFFPELEPWGYFLMGTLEEERLEEITERLTGEPVIIFHLQEGEETVYWAADKQYNRLSGYFVFYERNPQMQKYIAETEEPRSVEEESGDDQAIVSFREKVKEKTQSRRSGGIRYLASSFLVLTILMLGVTIVNGYDRMKSMETLIEQISIQQQEREAAQTSAVKAEQEASDAGRSTMSEMQTGGPGEGQDEAEEGAKAAETAGALENGKEEEENARAAVSTSAGEENVEANASAAAASADPLTGTQSDGALQDMAARLESQGAAQLSGGSAASIAEQSLAERNYSAEDAPLPDQEISGKTDEALEAARRQSQSVYTIKYGDTLADISQKYYGNLDMVEKICEQNEISDANLIVPGQKIVLP